MSYTIVYDRQVIKTPTGYSVVLLHGDNNVWNGNRRSRHWACVLMNESEEDCLKYYESFCGKGYQHFKWHGEFLNDEQLMRWIKNGIKNAHTIEEVGFAYCSLDIWHKFDESRALNRVVKTTEEFLDWIAEAKEHMGKLHQETKSVYCLVSFGADKPLKLSKPTPQLSGRVLVKFKQHYVSKIADYSMSASPNIADALIFDSIGAAEDACRPWMQRQKLTFHNADRLLSSDAAKQYVISFTNGNSKDYYVRKTKRVCKITCRKQNATRFTEAEARKKVQNIKLGNKNIIVQIEPLSEKEGGAA